MKPILNEYRCRELWPEAYRKDSNHPGPCVWQASRREVVTERQVAVVSGLQRLSGGDWILYYVIIYRPWPDLVNDKVTCGAGPVVQSKWWYNKYALFLVYSTTQNINFNNSCHKTNNPRGVIHFLIVLNWSD